jgi:hypothetical protein
VAPIIDRTATYGSRETGCFEALLIVAPVGFMSTGARQWAAGS